nr:hypothetical protein [uncultured Mediterranean phage uvMED]BAR25742.1 hypothetical protein [uncultured Mediterranean phage uvMED]
MSFSDGFSQGLGIANAFAKLKNNSILAEEKEEELRIAKMSLSDLEGKEDISVGEQTALSNIKQAEAATGFNVARTNVQNVQYNKEQILLDEAQNKANVNNTTVNNVLLTNTFQVFENLHNGLKSGDIKEKGVVYDMYLGEARTNIDLLRKDGKINLLNLLDPSYVEAISSVRGGLEALENGDPNGLNSLLDRPDALNTIFKPKADKFLGKKFIADNGFEGIVQDINLDIAKAVIAEDGQNAIMSANFEVFSQDSYDAAIKGGATSDAAKIKATQIFSTFMPDSAGEFLRQNTKDSSDKTQVSVTDMIDFAASSTNVLQAAMKYDGSFFKFAKELKDSQTYSKTRLDTDDKIKINEKVEELLMDNLEFASTKYTLEKGNTLVKRIRQSEGTTADRQDISEELKGVMENLGQYREEFMKYVEVDNTISTDKVTHYKWIGSTKDDSIFQAYLETYANRQQIKSNLVEGVEYDASKALPQPSKDAGGFVIVGELNLNLQDTPLSNLGKLRDEFGVDTVNSEIAKFQQVAASQNLDLTDQDLLNLLIRKLR